MSSIATAAAVLLAAAASLAQEPQDPARRIRELYLAFEDAAALQACDEWLAAHPGDPAVLELRARALKALGRIEEATQAAAALAPQESRARLLLAECFAADRAAAEKALEIADELAAAAPAAIEPQLVRARALLALGRFDEAAGALERVRAAKPKLYEGQLLAAMLAESAGRLDEAIRLHRPLLTQGSEFEQTDSHHERDAVMGLATLFLRIQRYKEAVRLLEQLVARCPKSPAVHARFAEALNLVERADDAIAALEKAVALDPERLEHRIRLADLYGAAGRREEAAAQFEKVLESGTAGTLRIVADLRLAEILLQTGDFEGAQAHAKAAAAAGPDDVGVMTVNARVAERLGDFAAAMEGYRRAFSTNPLAFDAMYRLAILLARSEDQDEQAEGAKLLERHKRIEPFLRDIRRAERELDLDPRSPMRLTRLAAMLNLAGEYEPARRFAELADRIDSRQPATLIQLGYVAANTGQNDAALQYFERAYTLLGGKSRKLESYVKKLRAGRPLPLPLGEQFRPARQPEDGQSDSPQPRDERPPAEPAKDGGS